jgi:hypothetical protein
MPPAAVGQVTSQPEHIQGGRRSRLNIALSPWLLSIILLLGVQGFLVFREPIFSPIDELEHVDYVRAIAEEARLPVYGTSRVDPRLLALYYHQYPTPLTPEQLARAPLRVTVSYEALQFPLFYVLAAPVYRLLDADPRTAVYGVRLLNVAISAVILLMLVAMLRGVFALGIGLACLIALTLLLVPGVALRNSQVTNEVLATLLVTVLTSLVLQQGTLRPVRRSLVEGGTLALAVLAKLTAIGAAPALLVGWVGRRVPLAVSLAVGGAGFVLAFLPWLAWSLPRYGHPVPFMGRHPDIFYLPNFALPATPGDWAGFLATLDHYFWFPWEWRVPQGPFSWLLKIGMYAGVVVFAAGLAWSIRQAFEEPSQLERHSCRLALAMLAGVLAGYVVIVITLQRVWPSDARELYVFLGPLAILLGSLATRLGDRTGRAVFGGLLGTWLFLDIGFYFAGRCVC